MTAIHTQGGAVRVHCIITMLAGCICLVEVARTTWLQVSAVDVQHSGSGDSTTVSCDAFVNACGAGAPSVHKLVQAAVSNNTQQLDLMLHSEIHAKVS